MAAVSDNLYISDLPAQIDEATVGQVFGAYGVISSLKMLPPRQPGQKAAALIRFASQQEATWIVDNLNGNLPEGLAEPVQVKYANESKGGKGEYGKAGGDWSGQQRAAPYGGKDAGKNGAKGGTYAPPAPHTAPAAYAAAPAAYAAPAAPPAETAAVSDNLYFSDLPAGIDEATVGQIFGAYGVITSLKVLPPRQPGQKGAALVRFATQQEATWIVDNLNGNMPEGLNEPVYVRYAQQGGKGGPKGGKGGSGWSGQQQQPPPPQQPPQQHYQPPPPPFGGKSAGKGGAPAAPAALPAPEPASAGDNLFISDLPADVDEARVHQIFGAYGTITSLRVLPPKMPGQKGAALVRFGTPQEASWILENLNGNMPEGLGEPVQVKYANSGKGGKGGYGKAGGEWPGEQRPAPYGGKDGGKGAPGPGGAAGQGIKSLIIEASKQGILPGGGAKNDEQCVYVKGLPSDTTDLDLYKLMAPFGAIAQRGVTAMKHPDGTCTSIGFVDFMDPQATQNCINTLNGFTLPDGTSLFLKTKNARKGGAKGDGKKGLGK